MGQDVASARSAPDNQLKAGDVRASNLLAAEVRRLTGDTVGQVKELIVSSDASVRLAVISVGGVLGVGGKTIALPFDQLQVAPDGATLYLTLSEEELSARPAFDLENVTADNGPATTAPAASEQQTLPPDASSPGFVPSGTTHESAARAGAEPPDPEPEPEPAQQAQTPPQQVEQQSDFVQPAAPEVAQADEPAPAPEVAQETSAAAPPAPQFAQETPEPAPPAPEVAQQPTSPQFVQPGADVAQVSPEPAPQPEQYQAVSKTKASNQPASALIGADVVDPQQSTVGKVNDVVVTADPPEVQVIVQLDESLAGSPRLVAVPLPELTIEESGADDTQRTVDRVETELTIAQLEALPQFQY